MDTIDLSQCVTNNATYAANVQPYTIGGGTGFTNFPVIITGTTAAIYPHHGLLTSNQTYYVTVDNGTFTDSAGAFFAGITDTNAWRFTTKPTGPAECRHLVVAQITAATSPRCRARLTPCQRQHHADHHQHPQRHLHGSGQSQPENNIDLRGQNRTNRSLATPTTATFQEAPTSAWRSRSTETTSPWKTSR